MSTELGAGGDVLVPDSVQGIIAARLDLLRPEEKELLQSAAVIGKVFWTGAVESLGTSDAGPLLRTLEDKDFVRRVRRASVAGENEYAFRHILTRDVAYAQIPRARRTEKHRLAAEWIESLGRPEDQGAGSGGKEGQQQVQTGAESASGRTRGSCKGASRRWRWASSATTSSVPARSFPHLL
jgi:hypothetical protein